MRKPEFCSGFFYYLGLVALRRLGISLPKSINLRLSLQIQNQH